MNEILFDSHGASGSEGVWQWVELTALRTTGLDSSWTLHDARGELLCGLPDHQFRQREHLVVLFGPSDAELDNLDPDLGALVVTAGLPWGDHIGVRYGGLQLRRDGAIVDELYWGGHPGLPQFSLSMDSGQLVEEGESIGRSSSSAYTGTAADWAIAGGENSNGSTPGDVNEVERLPADALIQYQDEILNEILVGMSISFEDPGWLQITGTDPALLDYDRDVDGAGTVRSRASHVLDIEIDGVPLELRGEIETMLFRGTDALATFERLECSGALTTADGSTGISFTTINEYTGAHTLQYTREYSTDYTWTESGVGYPTSLSGTIVRTWISPDVQVSTDTRTGVDHGGLGQKYGNATAAHVRLGDGEYQVSSSIARSWPSLPPRPGRDQSTREVQEETLDELYTVRVAPLGSDMPIAVFTNYRQCLGGELWAELEEGRTGEMSFSQTAITDDVTEYTWRINYPLRRADGQTFDHGAAIDGVFIDDGEKLYYANDISANSGGNETFRVSCAVDPPSCAKASQGTQGAQASRARPRANARRRVRRAMPRPKPKPTAWQRVKDFGVTTLTCIGGGVGTTKLILEKSGKRAVIKMVGRKIAGRLIPGVGWGLVACCGAKAIGDQLWGH